MKRDVQAPKQTDVKAPEPPKAEIKEFGKFMKHMVEQMAKRYRNQVFEQLHKSTVEKFADEQVGNFAKVFLKKADAVKRKLLKQFDDDRLEEMAKLYTGKVDRRNKKEFYRRIEKKIGVSKEELEQTEGLTYQINAYKLETFQWIRKMRDDTLQMWTSNTLRQMAEGRSLEDILSDFDGMVEKRKGHAEMVARTQISSFNSIVSKTRARNIGIEKAVWVTSKDERVRGNPSGKYPNAKPSHHWADGKEFDLAAGLTFPNGETLLPGISPNCRCDYRMLIPGMEEEEAA